MKDAAPSGPGVPTSGLRLKVVEQGMGVYATLGLFSKYRVYYQPSISAVAPA
jgi:hypothetical protein